MIHGVVLPSAELNEIDIRKQHERETRSAPAQQAMASAAGYNGTGGATIVYVVQAPGGQQFQGYPGQGYPGYPPAGYPAPGEGYVVSRVGNSFHACAPCSHGVSHTYTHSPRHDVIPFPVFLVPQCAWS